MQERVYAEMLSGSRRVVDQRHNQPTLRCHRARKRPACTEAVDDRVRVLFSKSPIDASSFSQHFSLGGEPVLHLTIFRPSGRDPD